MGGWVRGVLLITQRTNGAHALLMKPHSDGVEPMRSRNSAVKMMMHVTSTATHPGSVLHTYCGSVCTMKAVTDTMMVATMTVATSSARRDDPGSSNVRQIFCRVVSVGTATTRGAMSRSSNPAGVDGEEGEATVLRVVWVVGRQEWGGASSAQASGCSLTSSSSLPGTPRTAGGTGRAACARRAAATTTCTAATCCCGTGARRRLWVRQRRPIGRQLQLCPQLPQALHLARGGLVHCIHEALHFGCGRWKQTALLNRSCAANYLPSLCRLPFLTHSSSAPHSSPLPPLPPTLSPYSTPASPPSLLLLF